MNVEVKLIHVLYVCCRVHDDAKVMNELAWRLTKCSLVELLQLLLLSSLWTCEPSIWHFPEILAPNTSSLLHHHSAGQTTLYQGALWSGQHLAPPPDRGMWRVWKEGKRSFIPFFFPFLFSLFFPSFPPSLLFHFCLSFCAFAFFFFTHLPTMHSTGWRSTLLTLAYTATPHTFVRGLLGE